jgi:anti-sigma regulatory factor (Ser/Thr protein kinase)
MRISAQLRPDSQAPRIARNLIAVTCEASAVDADTCATAALLLSELVSNVVVHAATEIVMQILPERDRLRVEVIDRRPTRPIKVRTPGPDDRRGRGLHIVEQLATEWGVHEGEHTKTVWFELAIPALRNVSQE